MLYVSIGRNVGDVPMDDETWQEFQDLVIHAVSNWEWVGVDTRAVGQSRFGNMSEETAVFIWFDKNSPLSSQCLSELGDIARRFGQESIAWSVAPTQFAEGV